MQINVPLVLCPLPVVGSDDVIRALFGASHSTLERMSLVKGNLCCWTYRKILLGIGSSSGLWKRDFGINHM